jgi:hypothetical protein
MKSKSTKLAAVIKKTPPDVVMSQISAIRPRSVPPEIINAWLQYSSGGTAGQKYLAGERFLTIYNYMVEHEGEVPPVRLPRSVPRSLDREPSSGGW